MSICYGANHLQNKTILTVALSGSQGSKELNPNTPVTVEEMVEDAYQCFLEGASIVHVHMKANDQKTYEINYEKLQQFREKLTEKCDMIVNMTTSGERQKINDLKIMGTPDAKQSKRMGVIDLNPEIASFDVPTMNLGEYVFINPLPFLRTLGKKMQDNNVLPEVEIFHLGDIETAKQLIKGEFLSDSPYFQLCLGAQGGTPASVSNLLHFKEALPEGANWSAFGIGKDHLPIMFATLALGGHLRVGLEDNLYYRKGQLTSNVELVQRAVRVIEEYGNTVASPTEAREILGIQ